MALNKFSNASLKLNLKSPPIQELKDDLIFAYQVLRGLHNKKPAYSPYLKTLPMFCHNLSMIYQEVDNGRALFYARETENLSCRLVNLRSMNLDAIMTAGMSSSILGFV